MELCGNVIFAYCSTCNRNACRWCQSWRFRLGDGVDQCEWTITILGLFENIRVRLYWSESESDIAYRWVHKESNLMFALSSDKDQRKNSLSRSLSVNSYLSEKHRVDLLMWRTAQVRVLSELIRLWLSSRCYARSHKRHGWFCSLPDRVLEPASYWLRLYRCLAVRGHCHPRHTPTQIR